MTSATLPPHDIQVRNADARARDARLHHIEITIAGGTATLTGQVSSWKQRCVIEEAASVAPGVVRVDNRLEVLPAAV